jgi:hypothetical protein
MEVIYFCFRGKISKGIDMSKNIDQIYTANPIMSNAATDLMYFGQSPYGSGNDAAMTYANFSAQFGAPYTAAALTEVNDTNVTLTLGGTPSTALLQAVSITAGWAGQLAVGRGGTGTATFNTNGVVISNTTTTGALAALSLTDGQLVIGSSIGPPLAASITAGTGISVTPGHNTISISATGSSGITNVNQNSSSATLAANSRYATNNGASLVTYTLPVSPTIGDTYIIVGGSSGGWTIAQNASQQINFGNKASTSGTGGSLSSSNQFDCITITNVATNVFTAYESQGNITVV